MVTVTRERTGRLGGPTIIATNNGAGRRLYHYHNGLKVLSRTVYELVRGHQVTVGHRCPICGYLPNDAARAEQQQMLEAMLLRGFKRGRRS